MWDDDASPVGMSFAEMKDFAREYNDYIAHDNRPDLVVPQTEVMV